MPVHQAHIDKLVHGGQGLGSIGGGKKALVWNVLPGEDVSLESSKRKSSYVEGIAYEIANPSVDRETPRDPLYLSTSPWQMMNYAAENRYKQEILAETLERGKVDFSGKVGFEIPEEQWHYRNKMEYSFYGDDDGLHLALFNRGTHQKQIVTGSSIARPEIDATANAICSVLDKAGVRAGDLKSVIVRCNQAGERVAAIFTRNESMPKIAELEGICKGLAMYFSNPKSPASVVTKKLYIYGDIRLQDELLGTAIGYDVLSFFQVNLAPYELALQVIRDAAAGTAVTDMYAGAGSIGLSVADGPLKLIELDPHSVKMAENNAPVEVEVIHAASEKALEHIPSGDGQTVIFDPPRAGLHAKVTQKVLEQKPQQIIYLSCNPSTMARDLELLQTGYKIKSLNGYNFFPRTPHIEALAVLKLK
jgi:23S rRNA (uracil1939-C5)-methyltransferase